MMVSFHRAWTMPTRSALPSWTWGAGPLVSECILKRGRFSLRLWCEAIEVLQGECGGGVAFAGQMEVRWSRTEVSAELGIGMVDESARCI